MTYLKTLLFLIFVPGTVVFVLPYRIYCQTANRWKLDFGSLRHIAWLPWLSGAALILWSFWNFVSQGRGTPHPSDPPKELVVEGPYRYTRNPQYTGVMLMLLGHFSRTGALTLLAYAALIFTAFNQFVRNYEEPDLEQRFGESYHRYKQQTRRWLAF